jgi:quinoprotein relay system zinc metallohydrolase 2
MSGFGPVLARPGYHVDQIAPGVFVHAGVHEDISAANHGDIANAGFIVGGRCVAVIDTGGSPSLGKQLRQAIRKLTKKPICFVINTHLHPDHVLGNSAFVSDRPVFVGHAAMTQAWPQNADYFIDRFLKPFGEPIVMAALHAPERLVDGQTEIDLGERQLRLQGFAVAHTGQDLTVFDVKTSSLWLGDLLFMDRIPAIDGSLKGWLAALETLKTLPAARVIPGHGPTHAVWPDAAVAEQRYLQGLQRDVREIIHRGGTLEDALGSAGLSEQGHWRLFDAYHKRNVTKAFTESEWE